MSTVFTRREGIIRAKISLNEKSHLGGDLILKYEHHVYPREKVTDGARNVSNIRLSCVRQSRAIGSRKR